MYHYYDVGRLKFLTIRSLFIVNFDIAHAGLLSANFTKVA
jgi:hypothetical protein